MIIGCQFCAKLLRKMLANLKADIFVTTLLTNNFYNALFYKQIQK